jgi:two-component system, cell cycle sensor histidine kinase and response regulator CckA
MKTVLVLEDDPSNMQAFSAILWSMGYRVLEATTGKEAIETGRPHYGPIDLLLSDVDVPELSGTEVALELIKSHPTLSVLFVSGTPMYAWSRTDLANFRNLASDMVDFIEKPIPVFVLLERINDLIEKRGRSHSAAG